MHKLTPRLDSAITVFLLINTTWFDNRMRKTKLSASFCEREFCKFVLKLYFRSSKPSGSTSLGKSRSSIGKKLAGGALVGAGAYVGYKVQVRSFSNVFFICWPNRDLSALCIPTERPAHDLVHLVILCSPQAAKATAKFATLPFRARTNLGYDFDQWEQWSNSQGFLCRCSMCLYLIFEENAV